MEKVVDEQHYWGLANRKEIFKNDNWWSALEQADFR
jgi:hypothetical protein